VVIVSIIVVTDDRALQQFAQETVQGGSISASSNAAKNTQDGNLVSIVSYCLLPVVKLLSSSLTLRLKFILNTGTILLILCKYSGILLF